MGSRVPLQVRHGQGPARAAAADRGGQRQLLQRRPGQPARLGGRAPGEAGRPRGGPAPARAGCALRPDPPGGH